MTTASDLVIWLILGAAVGVITWAGMVGSRRLSPIASAGVGAASAVVGGLVSSWVLGDGATVRVSIQSGSSFGVTGFGLLPFIVAGTAALTGLVVVHRVTGRSPSSPRRLGL